MDRRAIFLMTEEAGSRHRGAGVDRELSPERGGDLRICPVCGTQRRPYGEARIRVAGAIHLTTVHYCRACDIFYRHLPVSVQRTRSEGAGYTSPSNREKLRLRREGFFRFILDLVQGGLAGGAPSLLDVGASYGHLLAIAKQRGFDAQGVEVVPRLREEIEARLGVTCWAALDEVRGEFDAATFIDSFYYFDDPHGAVRAIARLVRPGGLVVFRVTNRTLLVRACNAVRLDRHFELLGDAIVSWSMTGMRKVLSVHGLAVEQVRFFERGWRRPLRQWAAYGPAVAISWLSKHWNTPVAPGLIVVARNVGATTLPERPRGPT